MGQVITKYLLGGATEIQGTGFSNKASCDAAIEPYRRRTGVEVELAGEHDGGITQAITQQQQAGQ